MKENSNESLAFNAVILYIRLVITALCELLATRFALKALGIVDFGLFSLIGSIIVFMSVINTIMLSTSDRFIAIAIGKKNISSANEQFNVNLVIHLTIAIATVLIALPIGQWYILNYLNFDGDITLAVKVYQFTIIGSAISFVGLPYNGLLIAKEKFIVFCSANTLIHIIKTCIAYLLIFYFENKLIIYAISIAVLNAFPTFVYIYYCYRKYHDYVKLRFVRTKERYYTVLSFSGWVSYGAIACIGKSQGSALLVNSFFNTIMNSALGVANSINTLLIVVTQNITKPIVPQITKSFASNDRERWTQLLVLSTKISFLMMLLISSPFILNSSWVLSIWLDEVPKYAIVFTILLVIDALIDSINAGISDLIFASGKIKLYQLTVNTLKLCSILGAYILLSYGLPAYSMLCAYIFFTVIISFSNLLLLRKIVGFNIQLLLRKSYFPSLKVLVLFLPLALIRNYLHPLAIISIGLLYLIILIWYLGLSADERYSIKQIVKK